MGPDIFISYKREDLTLVKSMVKVLSNKGWNVWWDHDIQAGKDYDTVIQDAITDAKCVIVLWSERSINSRNVKDEANVGLERGVLIPVLIGNVKAPIGFRMIQAVVCKNENEIAEDEIKEICYQVKLMIGEPSADSDSATGNSKIEASKRASLLEDNTKQSTSAPTNSHETNSTKKIVMGIVALFVLVFAVYAVVHKNNSTTNEKRDAMVDSAEQAVAKHTAEINSNNVDSSPVENKTAEVATETNTETAKPTATSGTSTSTKKPKAESVKPKEPDKAPPAQASTPTYTPPSGNTNATAKTEPAAPPKTKSNVIDVSGKWSVEKKEIWIIKQSGSDLEISIYDLNNKLLETVNTEIIGNEISWYMPGKGDYKVGRFEWEAKKRRIFGKYPSKRFGFNNVAILKID